MYQNYFDTTIQQTQDWSDLARRRIGTDSDDFLRTLGIYPLTEERPEYDAQHELLTADGMPRISADGLTCVQFYVPVPRPAAEITAERRAEIEAQIIVLENKRRRSTDALTLAMATSATPDPEDVRMSAEIGAQITALRAQWHAAGNI